jgi:hypothetical protein
MERAAGGTPRSQAQPFYIIEAKPLYLAKCYMSYPSAHFAVAVSATAWGLVRSLTLAATP